jgi:hypothetical protein
MNGQPQVNPAPLDVARFNVARRVILRALALGGVAAAIAAPPAPALADGESDAEKRKPRYQADAPDVQAFYRVNRYPPKK